jgi:hypothetical protein
MYLGKGLEVSSNVAAIIGENILRKLGRERGSYETHEKSKVAAQDFICGNRSRADEICKEIFRKTQKAGVVPGKIPASGKIGLFGNSSAFVRCQTIDGLLQKNPIQIKEGIDYWSLLLKAGIASYSTSSEDLAEEELIVLYDIALSLDLKFEVQTPFIPKSILKNGYWHKRPV